MRKNYAFELIQRMQENMTLQILSLNVEFAFERNKLYTCIEKQGSAFSQLGRKN